MNKCIVCDKEISDKAKTCSPKCRQKARRLASVTQNNVSVTEPEESVTFQYISRGVTREAKYWYDIPIAGSPVYKKGWPECPEYMNVRQYFLWWKNNFQVGNKPSPFDGPIIKNINDLGDKK